MKIIVTKKYAQIKTRPGYDDVAKGYGASNTSKLRQILETEGEAAAEKYLESKGMSYGDIRAAIRALKG